MIDRWNELLKCPKCRNSGVASLSQSEFAATPTVEGVPYGFKAIRTRFGPNFHCGACDIPAAP
jgi:hypothetical protein